ncbi:hypothetical protein Droror1_Dr00016536 [Drosera rotundifolia]
MGQNRRGESRRGEERERAGEGGEMEATGERRKGSKEIPHKPSRRRRRGRRRLGLNSPEKLNLRRKTNRRHEIYAPRRRSSPEKTNAPPDPFLVWRRRPVPEKLNQPVCAAAGVVLAGEEEKDAEALTEPYFMWAGPESRLGFDQKLWALTLCFWALRCGSCLAE